MRNKMPCKKPIEKQLEWKPTGREDEIMMAMKDLLLAMLLLGGSFGNISAEVAINAGNPTFQPSMVFGLLIVGTSGSM